MNVLSLLALIIIGIIIATIPIYAAGKLVSKKATFGRALLAALLGPFVFTVVFVVVGTLTALIFIILLPLAFLVALVFLFYFYAVIFETSLLGGFVIAVVAVIISLLLLVIFDAFSIFAISLPGGFPYHP